MALPSSTCLQSKAFVVSGFQCCCDPGEGLTIKCAGCCYTGILRSVTFVESNKGIHDAVALKLEFSIYYAYVIVANAKRNLLESQKDGNWVWWIVKTKIKFSGVNGSFRPCGSTACCACGTDLLHCVTRKKALADLGVLLIHTCERTNAQGQISSCVFPLQQITSGKLKL